MLIALKFLIFLILKHKQHIKHKKHKHYLSMSVLTKILQLVGKKHGKKTLDCVITPPPTNEDSLSLVHHYNIKNKGVNTYLGTLGTESRCLSRMELRLGPTLIKSGPSSDWSTQWWLDLKRKKCATTHIYCSCSHYLTH